MSIQIPTLKECEKVIGEPASAWVARCYEIAWKLVNADIFNVHRDHGAAVYGHWIGPVHRDSYFAKRAGNLGFVQHGWIHFDNEALVVDPTRWVFEAKKPYLYVAHIPDDTVQVCKHCGMLRCEHDVLGTNDECGLYEPEVWPYDEGGNVWRSAYASLPPKPVHGAKRRKLVVSPDVATTIGALLGQCGTDVTAGQLHWLANLPYQTLQRSGALEVYQAIVDLGQIAFIPVDNLNRAKREAGLKVPTKKKVAAR